MRSAAAGAETTDILVRCAMRIIRRLLVLTALLGVTPATSAQGPPPAANPAGGPNGPRVVSRPFSFETDELWLNLHHFLYLLGRSEANLPDAREPSITGARDDAERGLRDAAPAERSAWADSVHDYAMGLSLKSTLEDPMASSTRILADLDDASTLSAATLDAALIRTLERAAPVYRERWWPTHRAANRAWQTSIQALVDRHGAAVIGFVTRAYELPWPADGYPVHVSSYANFSGAYSAGSTGMLVLASLTDLNEGLHGLEGIVHEAMHQWDGRMFTALRTPAAALGVLIPRDLPHALIFYTVGEAVRSVDASYVPLAEAADVWPKRLSGATLPAQRLVPILDNVWRPWLEGRGTRDEALAEVLERAAEVSSQ
jgi:hypothetical protein